MYMYVYICICRHITRSVFLCAGGIVTVGSAWLIIVAGALVWEHSLGCNP